MNVKSKSAFLKQCILAMVLTTGFAMNNEASAQTVKEESASEEKPVLLVNYVGKEKEFLVFEVNLSQPEDRRMTLRIADQANHELYNESFIKKIYSKRVLIPADAAEKISFKLSTSKSEIKKSFEVNYELKESFLVKETTDK